jgi:nitrate reductase NapD
LNAIKDSPSGRRKNGLVPSERLSMNISSLIVDTRPEHTSLVVAQLGRWPGVEVHAATPEGKLVVTLEAAGDGELASCFDRIRGLAGVMSAALVYHQFEPEAGSPETETPVPSPEEDRHVEPHSPRQPT